MLQPGHLFCSLCLSHVPSQLDVFFLKNPHNDRSILLARHGHLAWLAFQQQVTEITLIPQSCSFNLLQVHSFFDWHHLAIPSPHCTNFASLIFWTVCTPWPSPESCLKLHALYCAPALSWWYSNNNCYSKKRFVLLRQLVLTWGQELFCFVFSPFFEPFQSLNRSKQTNS